MMDEPRHSNRFIVIDQFSGQELSSRTGERDQDGIEGAIAINSGFRHPDPRDCCPSTVDVGLPPE
jgi:hypothetical protein